jgi:hypothetical protein
VVPVFPRELLCPCLGAGTAGASGWRAFWRRRDREDAAKRDAMVMYQAFMPVLRLERRSCLPALSGQMDRRSFEARILTTWARRGGLEVAVTSVLLLGDVSATMAILLAQMGKVEALCALTGSS